MAKTDRKLYRLYYERYKLLALNMFRWENLPPTIKSRNIEKALVFFQPAMLLIMALIVTSFIGYFLLPLIDILYKVG